MSGTKIAGLAAMIAVAFVTTAQAQTTPPPAPPPYATTKVEGTDNVYIFRYGGYLSMFIVTKAGVIVADPISLRRPAQVYIDEIRKVTQAPICRAISSAITITSIAAFDPHNSRAHVRFWHKADIG